MDGAEELAHVRRGHAGIDRRETAADIERIKLDAGLFDDLLGEFDRQAVGVRMHALAAYMEADAGMGGHGAHLREQAGCCFQCRAEFAGEGEFGVGVRDGDAHMQAEIVRILGFLKDFGEFFVGIERKMAHAIGEVGFTDRKARFDCVHEIDFGLREQPTHHRDFVQAGCIEMTYTGGPEVAQHVFVGVGFYRKEDLAAERRQKQLRRALQCVGTVSE